jgi:ribosome-binding protein aMBF1 (putative translation factor)
MSAGYLEINGRRYLIAASTGTLAVAEKNLPPLPKPATDGTVPALEYSRASLARKIIIERSARGWTQTELARRARVRVETINRLENARHTADPATAKKIQVALDAHRPAIVPRRAAGKRKAG